MRFLISFIFTLFCLIFILIPEMLMYWSWNLIHPTEELTKALVVIFFWFFGGSLCVFFAVLGFLIWISFSKAILSEL